MSGEKLLPCPFCGWPVDMEDPDTFYPTGTLWRYDEEAGCIVYYGYKDRDKYGAENMCYLLVCVEHNGGCGAEVHGDTEEETIAKWQRRAK